MQGLIAFEKFKKGQGNKKAEFALDNISNSNSVDIPLDDIIESLRNKTKYDNEYDRLIEIIGEGIARNVRELDETLQEERSRVFSEIQRASEIASYIARGHRANETRVNLAIEGFGLENKVANILYSNYFRVS